MQTPKGYDQLGTVKEICQEPRSYVIQSNGGTYRRNRRHILPVAEPTPPLLHADDPDSQNSSPCTMDCTTPIPQTPELNAMHPKHTSPPRPVPTAHFPSENRNTQYITRSGRTCRPKSKYINLKAALNEVDFVSTTADIWTANNRSYMGVTLHWISRSTLEHNKAALACRRIRGKHRCDVIGAEIEIIHSSYGLLNKVVATVTDNGSNFVKAFKVYQPVTESDDETEEGESTPTDDDVTFLDLSEILSAEDESDGKLSLPPHHRCASHTINLISINDVEKYLTSNAESKAVYRSSTAKCTALWTKSSRSTLASETVEEVSKRKLLVPTSTWWNSFFDAVKRIAEIPMSELNTLCTKLGVKCFKDKEYQFLHEYCTAMKPLTAALDILQGDCSYGTSLPTLEVLKTMAQSAYSAENEVIDYLRSAYDLQILHQFPNIKKIFLKYNTPTPSSAPVERLFSLGGLVLTPRRNRLSDKRFEKLLLMRYNHWFTHPTPLFQS
uniref:HAT C-terminal dimerisation domain-containing protein n=1 Tax=Dicentrarchus labrax TaxID=13489 RepID=A0A8C4H9B9_DICLA